MKIRLSEIPPEGLALTGKFDRDIFELDPQDSIQPAGHVSYDIRAEVDKDSLILSGSLVAPLKLRCVNCMEDFAYTLRIDDYLSDFDLEEDFEGAATIDLKAPLREDLLLAVPAYPHCNEGDDSDRVCPCEGPLHFESKNSTAGDGEPAEGPPSQWSALDQLGDSDR